VLQEHYLLESLRYGYMKLAWLFFNVYINFIEIDQ